MIYNTGSGRVEIKSAVGVVDGRWHSVQASRKGNSGMLTVDETAYEAQGVVSSDSSTDSIDYQLPVLVGGITNETKIDVILHDAKNKHKIVKMTDEFSGCMRDLTINGLSIGAPSASYGVSECSDDESKGIFLGPKGGYVLLDQTSTAKEGFKLEFAFRANNNEGLLMATGKDDFVALHFTNGSLTLTAKTASGNECSKTYEVTGPTALCDGHWHTVRIMRKTRLLTLNIDGTSKTSLCKSDKREFDFELKDKIVIGHPVKGIVNEELLQHKPFVGCVKILQDSKDKKRKRREEQLVEGFSSLKTYGDSHHGCSLE